MEVSSDFLILNCDFYSVFLNLLLVTDAREHDEVEGREEFESREVRTVLARPSPRIMIPAKER